MKLSHILAYIEKDGFDELRKVNTRLLEVAVCAIEQVSEKLQVVILQTGGKGYEKKKPYNSQLACNANDALAMVSSFRRMWPSKPL